METANSTTYRSNGKLLLTGEYLVLDGAQALALPTIFGQDITYNAGTQNISWKAYNKDKLWFECELAVTDFFVLKTSDQEIADYLKKMFEAVKSIKPAAQIRGGLYTSSTDFERGWGLGTSSSLISNMAYLFGLNPFDLHFQVSNGSAYDIACARAPKPIIYQLENRKPSWNEIDFKPYFAPHAVFVYLNRKQKSDKSVNLYQKQRQITQQDITDINQITNELTQKHTVEDAMYLLQHHEQIISKIIKQQPIQNEYYGKFDGHIKSLGAWGGDFVMCLSKHEPEYIQRFFNKNGLKTQILYTQMVK